MMMARITDHGNTHPNAIRTNPTVSIACPTTVDQIALAQNNFPFVRIFIFARIYEFENSPARYAIRLAITILGVYPRIFI